MFIRVLKICDEIAEDKKELVGLQALLFNLYSLKER